VEGVSQQVRLVGGRTDNDMSRFYMTLPSNISMDCYPDNSVARFTTKLNGAIELEGDWEVGLTKISFYSDVENVSDGHCCYTIHIEDRFLRKITLDTKHYATIRDLVRIMNAKQQMSIGKVDLFVEFFVSNGKIGMTFEYQSQVKLTVDFSPDFVRLSGLCSDESYVTGEDVISEREPNLTSNIHSVYIYCDLLEHVPVGDTNAPLLRMVNKSTKLEGNVHGVFNLTLYVPLQKKCFDTVEIDMMIDTGVPVPFLSGKSFVVLEFRHVIHTYYAI